jgi:aminoglycoside 6'-N-acetyltransferase I
VSLSRGPDLDIVHAGPEHLPAWLALREALWPEVGRAGHLEEIAAQLQDREGGAAFLAADARGHLVGLAEAAVRRDHVNGTESSPVAFLEGIYVAPEHRRRGVATRLVEAVAAWGRDRGCRELASDALLDNAESHAFHRAIGFAETERVVFFRREIGPG